MDCNSGLALDREAVCLAFPQSCKPGYAFHKVRIDDIGVSTSKTCAVTLSNDLALAPYELNNIHKDAGAQQQRKRLTVELTRLRSELKVPKNDPKQVRRKKAPKKPKKAALV